MQIIVAPDPVLRAKCEPVGPKELKKLKSVAKQMAKLMYKSQGCGLAAPQVGISKRLIVIDCEQIEDGNRNPTTYINPVIVKTGAEKVECDEGCLSIPGISIPIERFSEVTVEAMDLDGRTFRVEADDFLARCLQHEIDHLDGKTMFEHLDPIQRIQAFQEYEAALAAGAKPGDTGADRDGEPSKTPTE
jgi:peptide deformylase